MNIEKRYWILQSWWEIANRIILKIDRMMSKAFFEI